MYERENVPDLTKLRPNETEDVVAVTGIGTSLNLAEGAPNWGTVGAWLNREVGEGFGALTAKFNDVFDNVVDWLCEFDRIDIDQSWFDELGSQDTPFFGKDYWEEYLVRPNADGTPGSMDRFRMANQFVAAVGGMIVLRYIAGAIPLKDIMRAVPATTLTFGGKVASIAGNVWTADTLRSMKQDLSDVDDNTEELLLSMPKERNYHAISTMRDMSNALLNNDKVLMQRALTNAQNYINLQDGL